jgi:hypothetical protein
LTEDTNSKPWRTRHSVTARWPPTRSAVVAGLLEGGARNERLRRRLLVVVFGKQVAAATAPWATLVSWGSTVGPRSEAPSWYRTRELSLSERVFSPGPWTLPKGKAPGLTWTPPGGLVPRLDLVPASVLRCFYAPSIDRWAAKWMWRHGCFEVLAAERRKRPRDGDDADGSEARSEGP